MALSSHYLFTSSLRLSPNPTPISHSSSLFLSPSKTPFSLSKTALGREIRVFGFFRRSKNGFSTTSSAVATESTETASVARDSAQEEVLVEKIVLPTNESSEKLLRIRHTVISISLSVYPSSARSVWRSSSSVGLLNEPLLTSRASSKESVFYLLLL